MLKEKNENIKFRLSHISSIDRCLRRDGIIYEDCTTKNRRPKSNILKENIRYRLDLHKNQMYHEAEININSSDWTDAMKPILFTIVNWKIKILYPLLFIVSTATLFLALEPMILDSGRLTVTVEEATEGDIPGYIDYTYGSHEYDEYTITTYYPSGQKRVRPFDLSMVVPSDRDKFSMLGPQEIQVVYQKGSTTLKINVVLPSTVDDHIIVFETLGGLPIEDMTHIANNAIIELPVPHRPGYAFVGWYDNSSLSGNPLATQWQVTRSIVLYAKWEILLT